ncbi:MAG: glutaredoxin family protein [Candidatus Hodarchaeota archaeon]
MSLDSIAIPGNIVTVNGSHHSEEIFTFTISTCIWCKKGKRWLEERGFQYSYLDIDKIPVEEKNQLKGEIKRIFGVDPRFPFLVVNKTNYHSGYNPNVWGKMLE